MRHFGVKRFWHTFSNGVGCDRVAFGIFGVAREGKFLTRPLPLVFSLPGQIVIYFSLGLTWAPGWESIVLLAWYRDYRKDIWNMARG